jgi:4-amino-4-deoxy-L-arabinose transferase-like glycosyltransferase
MATLAAPVIRDEQRTALRGRLLPAVLAALAIRLVVVWFYFRQLPDANLHYEQFGWEVGWVARALASGHGFSSPVWPITGPTAMVPPLYTFLLAGIFKLFGIYTLTSGFIILTLNSLFSSLNCIAVYFSAEYSLGARAARAASWAWALYPFAIYFSADRVWEYALTSLLFTTCFCIAQRLHTAQRILPWIGFGLLYGVTAQSNPCVLSVFPLLLGFVLWRARTLNPRWMLHGACAAAALTVALTPWTIRNYRVLHVLCPVRDDYWINIYAGNYNNTSPTNPPSNPSAHPPSSADEMRKFLSMGEVPYLAEKHVLAAQWIRSHPGDFLRAVGRRAIYYWTGYWSFRPAYLAIEPTELPNMFYVCGVSVLMLLGLVKLLRTNVVGAFPYVILVTLFPITYYLSLVLMDYREPIEPAIVVLAIAGAFSFRRTRTTEQY